MKKLNDLVNAIDPLALSTQLLTEIPIQTELYFGDVSALKLRKLMFNNQGWQLSSQGHTFLKMYYTHYCCKSQNLIELTGKIIMGMDCIAGPWYIAAKSITVFDQNIYFELQMVNGDLASFVDFKK